MCRVDSTTNSGLEGLSWWSDSVTGSLRRSAIDGAVGIAVGTRGHRQESRGVLGAFGQRHVTAGTSVQVLGLLTTAGHLIVAVMVSTKDPDLSI